MHLRAGDVILLDRHASVQFGQEEIRLRVIREQAAQTDGWVWIDGYQLDDHGAALERRSVFVQHDALRPHRQGRP